MPQNHDQDNLFNQSYTDEEYGVEENPMDFSGYDVADGEQEEESEDFPEPAGKKKGGGKAKPNVALIAGGLLGAIALGLGGMYFTMPETLRDMLPEDMVAMLPEGTFPAATPAADPAAAPPADAPVVPHRRRRHQPAPADAAAPDAAAPAPNKMAAAAAPDAAANPAAPADQAPAAQPNSQSPEFQASPNAAPLPHRRRHHAPAPAAAAPAAPDAAAPVAAAPVAPRPHRKPHAAPMAVPAHKLARASAGGETMYSTAIAFAPHSYWVASAEVEKLWSISAKAGTKGGHFVVTSHPGAAGDESDLVGKRAEKLADMLRRNNRPFGQDVQVKSGAPADGSTGYVDVKFVKQQL